jgi:hypothetical protein
VAGHTARLVSTLLGTPLKEPFLNAALLSYLVLSVLLSIWTVVRAKRRRLRGGWLAITGAVLSCLWVLVLLPPYHGHRNAAPPGAG